MRTNLKLIFVENQPSLTTHVKFNHLMEHTLAAYRLLINRVYRLTLIPKRKPLELNTVKQLAQRN